jgi:hypothetical protein
MKFSEDKIDAAMQSYAKNWMKSIRGPRTSTTLGYFFTGLFILFWSSSLTALFGYDLKKGYGVLIFVGIGLALSVATIMINKFMARIGMERSIRSALWLSAVIGPYVNQFSYHSWKIPVISHIAGFTASILTFIFSYQLDKLISRYLKQVE